MVTVNVNLIMSERFYGNRKTAVVLREKYDLPDGIDSGMVM